MKGPFTIEIPKRGQTCSEGNEVLIPGKEFISLLGQHDSEQFERKDFCLSCWAKISSNKEKISGVHWKSRLPVKQDNNNKALFQSRNERALDLLRENLQQKEESAINEAFVLALFLARNRQLALRQELKQDNGDVFSIYEVLSTEEMLAVPRVILSQIQTEKIQQDLAKKFA